MLPLLQGGPRRELALTHRPRGPDPSSPRVRASVLSRVLILMALLQRAERALQKRCLVKVRHRSIGLHWEARNPRLRNQVSMACPSMTRARVAWTASNLHLASIRSSLLSLEFSQSIEVFYHGLLALGHDRSTECRIKFADGRNQHCHHRESISCDDKQANPQSLPKKKTGDRVKRAERQNTCCQRQRR